MASQRTIFFLLVITLSSLSANGEVQAALESGRDGMPVWKTGSDDRPAFPDLLLISQSGEAEEKDTRTQPNSGTIIIPAGVTQNADKDTKKCMNVCVRWGEDCIIDPNRGRKCRRMCKEFGEECF